MNRYSEMERRVLTRLQYGLEPVARPFQGLELPEAETLALLRRAIAEGLVRRFGGIFDARRLGYRSVLCALQCPQDQVEAKVAVIAAHPGVTHCYERRPLNGLSTWPPLWFTLALLQEEFDAGLAALQKELGACSSELLVLPALRRFKIDVTFDLRTTRREEPLQTPALSAAVESPPLRALSTVERTLVRAMDQQIPLTERPFDALAQGLGCAEEEVLSIVQAWRREGILRRMGAVLYHRQAGFRANAMCVWPVDGDCLQVGPRVAARSEVTHCYQRPRQESFPFDLYAMIHTADWHSAQELFEELSSGCGLAGGVLFASGREFKKSSMSYFV
jgi:DNA-binding Lrp family transcriptional regulator